MSTGRIGLSFARRYFRFATVLASGAVLPGFVESCDDRLAFITSYVDPCGSILGNCTPGSFQVQAADVGDFCVDPACTVPGGCGGGQPLGTITNVCP